MTIPEDKENNMMSEADRRIADAIAQHIIARLLAMAQDEETAAKIADVWVGAFDKAVGRGLRRALWYLALLLAGIASVKLGLIEKALGWVK